MVDGEGAWLVVGEGGGLLVDRGTVESGETAAGKERGAMVDGVLEAERLLDVNEGLGTAKVKVEVSLNTGMVDTWWTGEVTASSEPPAVMTTGGDGDRVLEAAMATSLAISAVTEEALGASVGQVETGVDILIGCKLFYEQMHSCKSKKNNALQHFYNKLV